MATTGDFEKLRSSVIDHVEQLLKTRELTDVNQAVGHLEEAIAQTPEDGQELSELHDKLGDVFIQRFRLTADPMNLLNAVNCWKKGAALTPGQYPDPVERLIALGGSECSQYERLCSLADLDKVIEYKHRTMSLTLEGHPDRPGQLASLGMSHHTRFKRLGNLVDLDKAIEYRHQTISLIPEEHSHLPKLLDGLSVSHYARFERLGNLADLDKEIDYSAQVLSLMPEGHPSRPRRLQNLGASLQTRFKRLGDLPDLDKAIKYKHQAVSLTPEGHPELPGRLSGLGISLQTQFERLGDLADLDKAIDYKHQTILLTPEDHPHRPSWLNSLGVSLHTRFERLGDITDLNRAIEYKNQTISLTLDGHADRRDWLDSLSESLDTRFYRLGNIADLNNNIDYSTRALSLTTAGDPDRPRRLYNLGVLLHTRCNRLGDLADLDKDIDYSVQALSLTPEGHPDQPRQLHSLGASLHTRFERLGDLADLDKAIEYKHRALSLTPEGHSDLPERMVNLGASFHVRFKRLGELPDLDKAIEYAHQAISLTPEGHEEQPQRFKILGISFHDRFKRLGDPMDLDKAIEYKHQAVSLTPEGHPGLPGRRSSFGISLYARYEQLGALADLERAIEHKHQAVLLASEGDPAQPRRLASLGISLHARFQRLDGPADLDKAIECKRQAVSLTPEGHPDRAIWLDTLGVSLHTRFEWLREHALPLMALNQERDGPLLPMGLQDLQESIRCFRSAAELSTGTPHNKLKAALHWARLPPHNGNPTILCAYTQAMSILPQLVWLGSSVESRYKRIIDEAGSLSTEAAALAISMQEYALALEWLEEGRSIVWKQMLQLRTPMDELFAGDSALATELKQVARDLDHASSPKLLDDVEPSNDTSLEKAAQQHRQLAMRWQDLVERARQLPGLEAFLRPQRASDLMRSAKCGPVVVINIHETHCDALVIQPGVSKISHIPLRFSLKKAKHSRIQLLQFVSTRGLDVRGVKARRPDLKGEFRRALGVLWKDVVKPILEVLGYLLPSTGELPHITWCTTGPLSFLPLHAAGDYASQDLTCNYVVSSYTPTLSALLSPAPNQSLFAGVLAVGQESTPNMNPLPGTVAELNRIQEQSQGHVITRLDKGLATPAAVMDGMERHSWVHLACHASQNLTNPLHSAFYLHGGKLDLATITQKQLNYADLAFLSACQTATGDESLSEEAVHLAAGMMMAGYRSVIATMWSIGDEDAPLVAEKVYEQLFRDGVPDARRAAVAVHRATSCLREKVGAEAFEKWVPYIHIGQ